MPNGVQCSSAECSVECVPTHLEAELVVILVEGDVHQTTTEAVVGKHKEHVLENLVNLSQVLSHSTHHVPVVGGARVTCNCEIKSYVTAPWQLWFSVNTKNVETLLSLQTGQPNQSWLEWWHGLLLYLHLPYLLHTVHCTYCTLLFCWNSSSRKLVMIHVIPMKRLMTMRKMYAVLGSEKTNDAGYIIGVIDHLTTHICMSLLPRCSLQTLQCLQRSEDLWCQCSAEQLCHCDLIWPSSPAVHTVAFCLIICMCLFVCEFGAINKQTARFLHEPCIFSRDNRLSGWCWCQISPDNLLSVSNIYAHRV